MKSLLLVLFAAATLHATDAPLYVFNNGLNRDVLSAEEQTELAHQFGYAGVFYEKTTGVAQLVAAHKARGMHVLGIYTGMNLSDAKPGYDPNLPQAIRELKGSGALITFTVNGKADNGDDISVPVIQAVADLAAQSGLRVAIYPHYGMYAGRIEDALRLSVKAARPNLGIVFNLCHWLRSGDEPNLNARLAQALPHIFMVSINGAEHEGDWNRLIQPLDQGSFDVKAFVATLRRLGYDGPIGLQCFAVKGDPKDNLARSMKAWRSF